MAKLKIWMLTHTAVAPGSRADQISGLLRGTGHDPKVMCVRPRWRGRRRGAGTSIAPGHPFDLLPPPFPRLAAAIAVLRWARRSRPAVIQCQGGHVLGLGLLAARLSGARLVYDADDGRWRRRPPVLAPVRRMLESFALRRAAAVIAGSHFLAMELRTRGRLATLPVVLHDDAGDSTSRSDSARLRQRLRLLDRTVVMHDGDRLTRDGCARLIEAVSRLPGTHLVVLGADRLGPTTDLTLLAARLRVAGRVHLLKSVPPSRLLAYLREADMGVVMADGSGDIPSQALRCALAGVPVVVSGHEPSEMLVERTGTGVIAEDTGIDALVEALTRASGAARAQLAARAALFSDELSSAARRTLLRALLQRLDTMPARGDAPPRGRAPSSARAALRALRSPTYRRAVRHPRAAVLFARALRLHREGHHEEAASYFQRAASRDKSLVAYLLRSADALKRSGRTAQAIEVYRSLIDSEQGLSSATMQAAVNLARLGAGADAEEVVDRHADRVAGNPAVAARVAQIQVALGDLSSARRTIEAADDDRNTLLSMARTRVLEQAGNPDAALRAAAAGGNRQDVARLSGTLKALDPAWRPHVVPRRVRPEPRTVLNLLETSLPYAQSGYTFRSATVVAAQRAAGFQPVVATRLGFPASRGHAAYPAVELVRMAAHHRFTLPGVTRYTSVPIDEQIQRNAELVAELAGEVRPEVVVAATPHFNGLLGLTVREALGVPFVYDVRGFPEMTWAVKPGGGDSEMYTLRRAAETRCMQEADAVFTFGEVMKQHIASRGVEAEKIHVTPHVVQLDAFAPRPPSEELVARYGLSGKLVVGYVTSLVDYEGVDTLLEALAILRGSRRDVVGLIVGDGASRMSLEAAASELGLRDSVIFTGRVPHAEVADHYAAIDVFVCPRRDLEVCRFVTPLKPFEALAMGRCMVASDLPVLAELLGDGAHGRLFPAGDAAALAELLHALLDAPDERRALGTAARAFLHERHGRAALEGALAATLGAVVEGATLKPASVAA